MTYPKPVLAALALVLTAACADTPRADRIVARDSAGISITELPAAVFSDAPEWRIAAEPTTRVGGSPESDIAGVMSAVMLDDGDVAFTNGMSSEIRIHSRDGSQLRSMGGQGEGPGEFQALWSVHRWPGDSLLAWDVMLRRATIFAMDGTRGRTIQLPGIGDHQPTIHGVLAGGGLLVSAEDRYKERNLNQLRRDTLPLFRMHSADGTLDSIASFAGQEQYEMSVPPVMLLEPAPFGATSHILIDADRIILADGRTSEIALLDGNGRAQSLLRIGAPGRAVGADDRAAFETANIDESWRPTYLAAKRQFVAVAPVPDSMPATGDVRVVPGGDIWIAEYVAAHLADSSGRTWWILTPDGQVRGRLHTPAGFTVMDVSDDHVLGVARDELGVESVLLYAIERQTEQVAARADR